MSVDTRGVIRVDDDDRVRTVVLDRPEARNAFNDVMWDAVRDALLDAQRDPGIAVVLVTGAEGTFTAGQDLGELADPPRHDDGERHGFVPFIEVLEQFDKPLLAAVNGVAVGIGTTMLAHCDLVVVAESARFRLPFVTLGVTMEAGSSSTLPRRIGWQETAHAVFTASWIDSSQALDIGLAWRRVPDLHLLDETMAVAREIAAMPVTSLQITKRLLLEALGDGPRQARLRELPAFAGLVGSPANREALQAFAEKRPPDFTNLPPE